MDSHPDAQSRSNSTFTYRVRAVMRSNNPLSFNRAASTGDYLVSRGVSSARISIDGRGSRESMAANDSPENMARNRRVEIFVAEPKEEAFR